MVLRTASLRCPGCCEAVCVTSGQQDRRLSRGGELSSGASVPRDTSAVPVWPVPSHLSEPRDSPERPDHGGRTELSQQSQQSQPHRNDL
eukprot:COSAG06_NODE_43056_length_375_cov_2.981884_1_plen_88_part_01